jgi:hypothetical protein
VQLQVEFERLGSPYGECVDVPGPDVPYYYDRKHYSVDACFRSCSQNALVQKCGCGDPRASIPDGVSYCAVDKSAFTDIHTWSKFLASGGSFIISKRGSFFQGIKKRIKISCSS